MCDVCSSAEAQFHPDSTDNEGHSEQLRTVSRGPTELLQDSVIRSDGEDDGRESGGNRREGRKTSLLMALSRPSPPIRRTQSHVTVSGKVEWFKEIIHGHILLYHGKYISEVIIFCILIMFILRFISAFVTEEEKKQKRKQMEREEEGSSRLQRSKTFFGLFRKRDSSRSRSRSPSRSESNLGNIVILFRVSHC